jgi:hypothetical protein
MSLGRAKDRPARRKNPVRRADAGRDLHALAGYAAREAEANLAGVYSVPLVLAGCVGQLLGAAGPVLLVSLSRGGVRQSFFDGASCISRGFRRSPPRASKKSPAPAPTTRPRYSSTSSPSARFRAELRCAPWSWRTPRRCRYWRNSAAAAANSSSSSSTSPPRPASWGSRTFRSTATPTTCSSTAWRPGRPRSSSPRPRDTRIHKLWRIRFALTSAAWLILAACLLYAGKTALNVYELRESIETTKAVADDDRKRYNALLDSLPKAGISPDNLRALIGRFEALQQAHPADGYAAATPEPRAERLSPDRTFQPELENCRQHRCRRKVPAALSGCGRGSAGRSRRRGLDSDRDQCPTAAGHAQRKARPARIDRKFRRAAARPADRRPRYSSRPFDIESDKPLKSAGEKAEAQLADAPKFALRIARQM